MTRPFRLAGVLGGHQPVFCTADHLYLFRRGRLLRADHGLRNRSPVARIPSDKPFMAYAPRIAERVFRAAVQSAAALDERTLLLARRSRIWRVDLRTGDVALDLLIPDGRSLLALTRIAASDGGADWIVFGDYFHNPARAEVRLWRRRCERDARWEAAATFPAGRIDHVHAVHQRADGRIHVLTGDFDAAAGFWRAGPDLGHVEPAMVGDQRLRACWWFERDGRVSWGTDSQFEPNALVALGPDERSIETLRPLPGSCIYHGRTGGDLVFSTTVEPGATTGSPVRDLLDRSAGPGITGDPAIFHLSDDAVEVLSAPKDRWPARLGQFGTFMFPGGVAPADRFYAYGVAVKGYDGACLAFERR